MKLSDIYNIADELAPKRLSDEICSTLGWYDNSGILIDVGEDIKGVVCSLDLSLAAIDDAIERGANLIITHHPAIFGKLNRILYDDESLVGGKLVKCIRKGISVISMHLNLDLAPGGTDESLMNGVYLAACVGSEKKETEGADMRSPNFYGQPVATMNTFSGGAYGRVYNVPETKLKTLAEGMEKLFGNGRVSVYGDREEKIKRVASFCGAGADESAIAFAKKHGADVLVSSDFKHHVLSLAAELGVAVVTLTHYASEHYGFKKYYEKIRQRLEIPCAYHTDENLL